MPRFLADSALISVALKENLMFLIVVFLGGEGWSVPKPPSAAFLSWLEKAFDSHQMFSGHTGPGLGTASPASCLGCRQASTPRLRTEIPALPTL